MQEITMEAARQSAPWKPSQSWWVVGIEGIAALIIGIYIVAFPTGANDIIRVLIAAALLLLSIGQIVEGFRQRRTVIAPWVSLRGGAGAMAAALTLLAFWSEITLVEIQPAGARQILAAGLLTYGAIGIVSILFTFRAAGFTIAALIVDLLAIAVGVVLLAAEAGDIRGTQILGVAAIVGGVALLVYAYVLWSRTRTPGASPPQDAAA